MASYITPADPITWSSSTAYKEMTLVSDTSGKGYVSKKAVPQGTALTNTEYWVAIPNLGDAITVAQQSADEAKDAAEAAQTAATSASSSASKAVTAANEAKTAASSAQSTADLSQKAALAAQIMIEMTQGIYPIS